MDLGETFELLVAADLPGKLQSLIIGSEHFTSTETMELPGESADSYNNATTYPKIIVLSTFFKVLTTKLLNQSGACVLGQAYQSPRPFSKPRLRLWIRLRLAWPRGCFYNCA